MRRWLSLLVILPLVLLPGCGSNNNNTPTTVGLFGNWNVVMDDNAGNVVYAYGLALSQEGPDYSGGSISYTGSTAQPTQCIDPNTLSAEATTSGNNFTLTVVDTTTSTTMTLQGSLTSTNGSLTGTFSSTETAACRPQTGAFTMSPQ